ncbi:DUF3019 domain-containing protein [uncultured Shewanella sp.]|uniref:DUF3019 domain-containing protein n=1 Tax=uncultured Shewanella sp. TaxID=173975 RepID=UPI0034584B14
MCGKANGTKNKEKSKFQPFFKPYVTFSKQLVCHLMVKLKWTHNIFKPIDLLSSYHELIKWCKASLKTKSIILDDKEKKDIVFIVIEKETSKTLVGSEHRVNPTSPSHLRQQFRNAWSLF